LFVPASKRREKEEERERKREREGGNADKFVDRGLIAGH